MSDESKSRGAQPERLAWGDPPTTEQLLESGGHLPRPLANPSIGRSARRHFGSLSRSAGVGESVSLDF